MAFLINRNAAARIECLHALARLAYSKFGENTFSLNDIKFDKNGKNIYEYCRLLKQNDIAGEYCRFKNNPLDDAGCAITNGVLTDTTKSKEASNTINALHALGFVERAGHSNKLTKEGVRFAKTPYESPEMSEIIKTAVTNYGPIAGIMHYLSSNHSVGDQFSVSELAVGYPSPVEYVIYNDHLVKISSGSKQDSNIRTRSCLLAWLTTAGYIKPAGIKPDVLYPPQVAYRSYINKTHRAKQFYIIVEIPPSTETKRPLDYINLTKLNTGLRERGMAEEREATIEYEPIIKNRRFAIIFLLNKAYRQNKLLPFDMLTALFEKYPDLFIVSENRLDDVIVEEIEIAPIAGIPYTKVSKPSNPNKLYLKPEQGINMNEASKGAPDDLIRLLNDVKI